MACWGPGNLAVGVEGGNPLGRTGAVDCTVDLGNFEDLVVVDCH